MEASPPREFYFLSIFTSFMLISDSKYLLRGLRGISICNRDSDFTWFTLKSVLVKLAIKEGSSQEK